MDGLHNADDDNILTTPRLLIRLTSVREETSNPLSLGIFAVNSARYHLPRLERDTERNVRQGRLNITRVDINRFSYPRRDKSHLQVLFLNYTRRVKILTSGEMQSELAQFALACQSFEAICHPV